MDLLKKIKDVFNIRKEIEKSNREILELYDVIASLKKELAEFKIALHEEREKSDKLVNEFRQNSDKWE